MHLLQQVHWSVTGQNWCRHTPSGAPGAGHLLVVEPEPRDGQSRVTWVGEASLPRGVFGCERYWMTWVLQQVQWAPDGSQRPFRIVQLVPTWWLDLTKTAGLSSTQRPCGDVLRAMCPSEKFPENSMGMRTIQGPGRYPIPNMG